MMRVAQFMKRELVSVEYGASISTVAAIMRQQHVGSILVKQADRIVGILTESDIVRRVVALDLPPASITVEYVMSAPLITIEEDQSLFEAADLMDQHKTRHLAVINEAGIVGIISVRDFLRPVAVDDL